MALKDKIAAKNLPPWAKIVIPVAPVVVITVIALFVFVFPKNKEIKEFERKIAVQENEIAKNQAKAEKLPELTVENEQLRKRLEELKKQLPEEKEVSTLLRQVSELAIRSGLKISLWKPEKRKTHPSGIVYEIPVRVELSGSYHSLGYFFSSLTKLNRIVNISDIKLGDPRADKGSATLKISFIATTFSSVPEEELENTSGKDKGKKT